MPNSSKPYRLHAVPLRTAQDTVVVSPSAPIQTVNGVVARLLGDLSAFTQPLDLTSKLLFIPIRPDNHPRVQQGISKWVMVDRTEVELSGGVCDKIGVSFEAFRKQGEKCESFPGDCLKNQLEDLVEVHVIVRPRARNSP